MAAGTAVSADGWAVAAWYVNGSLHAGRYHPTTGWNAARLLDASVTTNARMDSTTVGIGSSSDVAVAWSFEQRSNSESVILVTQSHAEDSGWNARRKVASLPSVDGALAVTNVLVDDTGNITLLWRMHDASSSVYAIYGAHYERSTDIWSTPVQLSNPSSKGFIDTPKAGIDDNGNVTALWSDGGLLAPSALEDGGPAQVLFSTWTARYDRAAGTWSPSTRLDTRGELRPALAVRGTSALALWALRLGDRYAVSAAQWVSNAWAPRILLETDVPRGDDFTALIATDGSAYGVWRTAEEPRTLRYSRYDSVEARWSQPATLALPGNSLGVGPRLLPIACGSGALLAYSDSNTRRVWKGLLGENGWVAEPLVTAAAGAEAYGADAEAALLTLRVEESADSTSILAAWE